MLKLSTTLLVIYAILSLPFSTPLFAQTQVQVDAEKTEAKQTPDSAPDMRRVIAQNEKKYSSVDVKALEKLERQIPQKRGLTGKQKAYIVLGIVGLAALIFVLVKYGKDCLETNPPNCTSGVDEGCTCTQYAQNL